MNKFLFIMRSSTKNSLDFTLHKNETPKHSIFIIHEKIYIHYNKLVIKVGKKFNFLNLHYLDLQHWVCLIEHVPSNLVARLKDIG